MATATERRMRKLLQESADALGWMIPKYQNEFPIDLTAERDLLERLGAELKIEERSAQGKSNRSRGHATERMVVNYLRRGDRFPDADTTRNRLGHDGTRQPGDVWFVPGVVLSVKHVKTPAWPAWLREVVAEALVAGSAQPGVFSPRMPAVVHRKLGESNVGAWPCAVPLAYWDDLFAHAAYDRPIADYDDLLNMFGIGNGIRKDAPGWVEHCRPGKTHVAVMRFETFVSTYELSS
jgi:hypothetical protein